MTPRTAASNGLLLSPLLESRTMCACIAGAAAAHLALVWAGLDGWPCPVRHAFGIPCPGCGLGRAGALLLRGQWTASLQMHAFAGPLIAAVMLFAVAAILPATGRLRLARGIGGLEARAPLMPAFLWALVFYWLLRFALDAPGFIRLVT
jgi:hypothetical protein